MADFALEFDAAASNPDGTNPGIALALSAANGWSIAAFATPPAELKTIYAGSIDTDGDRRVDPSNYNNRTIQFELWQRNSTNAAVETALGNLRGKLAKISREGGTLKITFPNGDVRFYDIVAATYSVAYDPLWIARNFVRVQVVLTALPASRGASVLQADRTETTLPALIATETGITGDVDAGGTWVIDNDAAAGSNWWGLAWGIETNRDYTFTDSTGSGGLFYEAESRTAMGGSATAAGPTGASGGGSNVMRNTTLTTTPVAIMSTQASGGGAHLSHVGTFQVWTRVQVPATNSGTVSVALEYGVGDFLASTTLDTRAIDAAWEGTWRKVYLGLVVIPKVAQGTQRWEGRILAKSTIAGDDIDIDWVALVPVDEGWGRPSAVARVANPTSFSARDEYDQTAGNLTGKTLPVGGTWTFSHGDADDFTMDTTNARAQRATASDTATRFIYAGTPSLTNLVTQVDFSRPTPGAGASMYSCVLFRWVDANNYAYAIAGNLAGSTTAGAVAVFKVIAGVETTVIGNVAVPAFWDSWRTLRVEALADGNVFVWFYTQGGTPILMGQSADAALATGGTLASGKVGIGDYHSAATAPVRAYDNFAAWVPAPDAAVFAGQSIEIRHDRVIREDSTGAFWQSVSDAFGGYLLVPPAGAEARSTRFIALPLLRPEVNGVWLDDRIDDISGRLTYYARYLT